MLAEKEKNKLTGKSNEEATYLASDYFADWKDPLVIEYAKNVTPKNASPIEIAVSLYYAIRDDFRYNPFTIYDNKKKYKASEFLQRQEGHCIDKANLLIACCRLNGIPARYRFANVRNHVGTEKLEAILKTDILVYHGMAELFIDNQWVKATPAFNKELCEKLNVVPLEFNGKEHSIFQEYDRSDNAFMEYLHDYGSFHEFPFEQFISTFFEYYPHLRGSEYILS
ncbi:MAG: transglutaminase-like domain-containing protein [Cellvibrionaceae bacterium]